MEFKDLCQTLKRMDFPLNVHLGKNCKLQLPNVLLHPIPLFWKYVLTYMLLGNDGILLFFHLIVGDMELYNI